MASRFLTFFTFCFWTIIFFVIWARMLVFEPDGLWAGWVNVWGDWAAHISYTVSLASQNTVPPQFPILSGQLLSYPFAADFISSLMLRAGLPLTWAMLFPSFILSVILILVLFWFFKKLAKDEVAASLGVFLFLFSGGLGFLWFANAPQEFTHIEGQANIEWINIITSEIIPQRGFLLGLPMAISLLGFFWQTFQNQNRVSVWWFALAGVTTGFLPLIHFHSFFVILSFSFWTLLLTLKRKLVRHWIFYFLPAILVAALLIKTFFPQFGASHINFRPGWLADQVGDNIFFFWWKNAGVMLLLPLAGVFLAFKEKKKEMLFWTLPFWGIFLVANLFTFQPYDWDNTKFFTFWWLGTSAFAAFLLARLLTKTIAFKLIVLLLFVLATASGALDVARLTQYSQLKIRMLSNEQIRLAEWAKTETPKDTIFLTADNHDNPIAMLSGRRIVLGFPGWLWTYGIDTQERKSQVEKIFKGEEGAQNLLQKLGVDYVVLGPAEKTLYPNLNEEFFAKNFPLVFRVGETGVFATNQ